jgi:hypothetical protein
MGQISADTAIISKEPVTDLILLIAQEGDITPTRRDRTAEGQNEIRIEQAIASIAEEDGEGMGDEEAQEDMSLVGMMAPPDDMDMMAMEEAPQEMAVEEEDPELMEI